jgi:DNA primase
LVEGSLDTVRVWQAGFPAYGIYGSSLAESQITLLHRLNIEQVLLWFDNDSAGRRATYTAKQIIHNLEIVEVPWKLHHLNKDPGGLSLENINKYLQPYF